MEKPVNIEIDELIKDMTKNMSYFPIFECKVKEKLLLLVNA